MFVCLFITQEPLDRFASNFIGELGRATGMFLFFFKILSWVGRLLSGKIAKNVIYDQVRVNGGSNYEYAGFTS